MLRRFGSQRRPGRLRRLLLAAALICLPPSWPAAAPVEPVAVRAAVHAGFGRLVLEWPHAIAVDGRQDGRRLVLRFARPSAPDLTAAADTLRDYVTGIARGGDGQEVVLTLPPGVTAAIATYDERIVAVDLARNAPAAASPVELRTGTHPGFGRIVLDWGRPIAFEATSDGRRRRIVFDRAAAIDALTIGQRFRHLLDAASSAQGDGRSELRLALKPAVRAEIFAIEGTRVVIDLHEPAAAPAAESVASAPPQAAQPEPAAGAAPPAAPAAAVRVADAPPAATGLALDILPTGDVRGAALDFVWGRPVPAAFLIRAGYLWSVFMPPAGEPLDLPTVFPSPLPGHLGPGEPVAVAGGQAIRFALRRPLTATVERSGARWRVVLGAAPVPPQAVRIEAVGPPPRLRIEPGETVRLVYLIDPEVGDELVVWPLLRAGLGLPAGRRMVEVELLPTAQGLAWRARSDDLRLQVSGHAVELLARDGLSLSVRGAPAPVASPPEQPASAPDAATMALPLAAPAPATPVVRAAAALPPVSDEPEIAEDAAAPAAEVAAGGVAAAGGALDLARFRTSSLDRGTLQQRIAGAAPAGQAHARLELARWFLARAMAPEALAALAAIDEAALGPELATARSARRHLTGAAQLLSDRLDEAAPVLGEPALDGDAEIALWRAALAGAREDWPRGAAELDRGKAVLARYPPMLRLRLGLPAVQAAIEAGRYDLAKSTLGTLRALELRPAQRAQIAFVEGLLQARRGVVDRATEIWHALEEGPDHDSRIKAGYARVQLLLDAGRLSPDDAVARLARVRALWRGHPWQARMLEGLAELYRQSGDRAAAIRTWHDLLVEFPALPDAQRIEVAMRDAFAEALQQNAATGAVRAYALYRDFPDLVAAGPPGDRLRQGLATRLAELDLLEPAAELLGELVERRLSGPAKATAGADLAALRLRQPDPAAALAALERSRVADGLPAELERRRRLLQARALAAAERPAEALALLDGRRGPDERQLQAEILWQLRDWPRLALTLEDLLAPRAEAAALSEAEQDLVIRLAVAYDQQADRAALVRLRARFGAGMSGQPGEPAFLMATMAPGRPVEPEAVLAVAAEHLGRVRDYLAAAPAAP